MTIHRHALAASILASSILGGLALSLAVHVIATALQPPAPGPLEANQEPKQLPPQAEPEPQTNNQLPDTPPPVVKKIEADPHNRPHEDQAAVQQNQPAINWRDHWKSPITYFTLLLTIVAGLQFCLARQQAEQRRTEQRAWLVFKRVEPGELGGGHPIQTKVHIGNTGATPAFIERQHAEIYERSPDTIDLTSEVAEVATVAQAGPPGYQVVMAPHGEGHVFTNKHKLLASIELDGRLKRQESALFLIGIVCYRDAFDREHTSRCCFRFVHADWKFVGHRRHNYMT